MADRLIGPSMLAFVVDATSGPDLWRVLQPITALEKAGYPCGWAIQGSAGIGEVALRYQAHLLPRFAWTTDVRDEGEAWFADCRRRGMVTVYDLDDDILTSWDTHRRMELNWTEGLSYEQLQDDRSGRIWTLQQCDGVTVSTEPLAEIVRSYTDRPVIVVPNAIDVPWFRGIVHRTPRTLPGVTIGWAGGYRHDRDVEAMAIAWGRIARRFPAVRFVMQGSYPKVILDQVPADRLTAIPWLPLHKYPAGLAQVDIGCCAVADTPFNHCKSPIKAMEYAAAGAAVVASRTVYSGIVEDGSSGFLAESETEWENALFELVSRPARRSMMAKRLLKVVERKHSLAGNLWRWPAAWQTIAESARTRKKLVAV